MIEKNSNIYKKSLNRILEIDPNSKRVQILDQRFYTRHDKHYPSVTSILQFMPKGKFFETWLKDVGHNADIIARKAADEGTQTHEMIEKYLEGEKINWLDDRGQTTCSLEVWKMLLKFVEFWDTYKPELLGSEVHLFSDEHEYAGTGDLTVKIDDEIWLLDIKTSNSLHTSYDLQLAAYAKAWNETYEEKVIRTGILWLKSSKRGEDKKGKTMQGKGWEVYESPRTIDENIELFLKIYDLYKLENPNDKPSTNEFPTSVQLENI